MARRKQEAFCREPRKFGGRRPSNAPRRKVPTHITNNTHTKPRNEHFALPSSQLLQSIAYCPLTTCVDQALPQRLKRHNGTRFNRPSPSVFCNRKDDHTQFLRVNTETTRVARCIPKAWWYCAPRSTGTAPFAPGSSRAACGTRLSRSCLPEFGRA